MQTWMVKNMVNLRKRQSSRAIITLDLFHYGQFWKNGPRVYLIGEILIYSYEAIINQRTYVINE